MGNIPVRSEQQYSSQEPSHVDMSEYLNVATEAFIKQYNSVINNKSIRKKCLDDFVLYQCLGKGAFASVYLAQERGLEKWFYAIKVLNKRKVLADHQEDHVLAEKRLLSSVNFQFLIKLYHSFKDNSNVYLSLEFMPGGELFSLLRCKMYFTEDTARFYAAQVVLALEYLHHLNIAYRDLKPENILLAADGYLKIADFGFAKLVPNRTYTLCGTPEYLAPEIIASKGYSRAVDWWAFGVLLFELVAGFSPFFSERCQRIYEKILVNKYTFPRRFSMEIRSLLQKLLEPDLSKRIGTLKNKVNEVKEQRWFCNQIDWAALFEKKVPLPPEIIRHKFSKPVSLGPVTTLDIEPYDIFSRCFDSF